MYTANEYNKIYFKYPSKKNFISVIIPVYKDYKGLSITLKSLEQMTFSKDCYEIIVVNDGAEKSINKVCKKHKVKCISIQNRRGSYHARDIGLSESKGAYIAFTDADVVVDRLWLKNMYLYLNEYDYVVGKTVINSKLIRTISDDYEHATAFIINTNRLIGPTVNIAVKRSVIEIVGGFDRRLESGGDYEFGDRVTQYKPQFRKRYAPKAVILHPPRGHKELVKKNRRIFKGKYIVLNYYPSCRAFGSRKSTAEALKEIFRFEKVSDIAKKMEYSHSLYIFKWIYVWYMEVMRIWYDEKYKLSICTGTKSGRNQKGIDI